VAAPWGAWGDTSIRGNRSLGSGILNNEFYIGEMIWNRRRRMKNPDTGRMRAEVQPGVEWVHVKARTFGSSATSFGSRQARQDS
jgi:site-specific DNA recombinase